MISKLLSIPINTINTMNSINMKPNEENDYGFFCDLEEEFCIYPKQKIGISNLYTIIEEKQKSASTIKLEYDNLVNEIYKINIRSVIAYIVVSLSSVYLTTKLFYRYNP